MKYLSLLLILVGVILFSTCKKDKDENPYYAKLVAHSWKVSSFMNTDTTDIAAEFAEYRIQFKEDGTATATKGSSTTFGTYTIQEEDPSAIELTIGFAAASNPLDKMIGLWDTNENDFTDGQLKMEQDGPSGLQTLTLVTY